MKVKYVKEDLIYSDPVNTAEGADLEYVSDQIPGITRIKKGKGWIYKLPDGKKCSDTATLNRIKKLAIPPAWKNVWISKQANGHLQATGFDLLNRKQYKYHPDWEAARSKTKFHRMQLFGQLLPVLRKQIEMDLRLHELCEKKVIALVIYLMDKTGIRIGNSSYEKLYGSYGLTTLRDKHVKIRGSKLKIQFIGKKGIQQDLEVTNAKLARLVKKCRDIPGQELFQYYDVNGERKKIDSGMINQYIREITGERFTAKDFRTWKASVFAMRTLLDLCGEENEATQKNIIKCFDAVSKKLGNSKNICKKYYVHPALISTFEQGIFSKYKGEENKKIAGDEKYYRFGEIALLDLLQQESSSGKSVANKQAV